MTASDPAARVSLAGADPTNWASLGLRKLVRKYVTAIAELPGGFVLLLPDPEYPVAKSADPAFARATRGRAVAAFRANGGGHVSLVAVATPEFEPRVQRVLSTLARLDALGIVERERGEESLVAFAMNVYDEFGLHCAFAEIGS